MRIKLVAVLAVVVVLLTSCGESANGTNYGWVRIYGGDRATCGREDISTSRNEFGYVTQIRASGTTWLEERRDTICNSSWETGARYIANEGWLGNSVRLMENGVTCAFNGMSYNGSDAYSFTSLATCANDYPTDQYRAEIVHRWYSVDRSGYAVVTASTPTINQ